MGGYDVTTLSSFVTWIIPSFTMPYQSFVFMITLTCVSCYWKTLYFIIIVFIFLEKGEHPLSWKLLYEIQETIALEEPTLDFD